MLLRALAIDYTVAVVGCLPVHNIIGMQQNSRIVLNRSQLRETILLERLNQVWNHNKLIYVLMLLAMFLVSIATILYVLDAVVVPSTRYTYLERLQSEQFSKYLAVNNFQQSVFGFGGLSSNPSTPSKVKVSPQHLQEKPPQPATSQQMKQFHQILQTPTRGQIDSQKDHNKSISKSMNNPQVSKQDNSDHSHQLHHNLLE